MTDCKTCGKTTEQLQRREKTWQCSHVDCPKRKSDLPAGYERTEFEPLVEGCYRVKPRSIE